jgi:hypothetical protein
MSFAHYFHAEQVTIEWQRLFRVLDSQHSLLEAGLSNDLGGWHFLATNENFDPVVVWVQSEGNRLHHAFKGSLLELDTLSFQVFAEGL